MICYICSMGSFLYFCLNGVNTDDHDEFIASITQSSDEVNKLVVESSQFVIEHLKHMKL